MNKFIAFLFLIIFFACGNANNNQTPEEHNASIPKTLSDSLYKSVIEGHDVGMPRMGEIVRLKNEITQKKDSLSKLKGKGKDTITKYDTAYNNLAYAEELMNKWMHDFDPDKAGSTEEEKVNYFKKELEKVDTVNMRINNSIEGAKKITAAKP